MWYGIMRQVRTRDYISHPEMITTMFGSYKSAENAMTTLQSKYPNEKLSIVEIRTEVAHGLGMQGGGPT